MQLAEVRVTASVTWRLYYFSIFGHLEQWKVAQKYEIFAKVGWRFCQFLNSYSRYGQNFLNLRLSGEISAKSGHTGHRFTLTATLAVVGIYR